MTFQHKKQSFCIVSVCSGLEADNHRPSGGITGRRKVFFPSFKERMPVLAPMDASQHREPPSLPRSLPRAPRNGPVPPRESRGTQLCPTSSCMLGATDRPHRNRCGQKAAIRPGGQRGDLVEEVCPSCICVGRRGLLACNVRRTNP